MEIDHIIVKLRHVEEQFEALQADYRNIRSSITDIKTSISELREFSGEILYLHLIQMAKDDAREGRVPSAIKKLKKAQNLARHIGNEDHVRDLDRQIEALLTTLEDYQREEEDEDEEPRAHAEDAATADKSAR